MSAKQASSSEPPKGTVVVVGSGMAGMWVFSWVMMLHASIAMKLKLAGVCESLSCCHLHGVALCSVCLLLSRAPGSQRGALLSAKLLKTPAVKSLSKFPGVHACKGSHPW